MNVECSCGCRAVFKPFVVETIAAVMGKPEEAASIWTDGCPTCAPTAALHVWGWVLADGTRTTCEGSPLTADDRAAMAIIRH